MAQITSGIKSILSYPLFYNLFQNIIGAEDARRKFVSTYCQLETQQRWLDVGCGTAELLKHLPKDIQYVGFDTSAQYIQHAEVNYEEHNAKFYTELLTDKLLTELGLFERAIATGLLHHLDDIEVIYLFNTIKSALSEDGLFITFDPCYISDQSFISKFLIDRDRGQNVRKIEEYYELALKVFEKVELIHRNNMLRIPYDHVILICQ
ncbi:MAG: class I SAM-dependent methyltransferase [Gammaproteobacteria bacterium]|nr:class I SAM-dependent methyltransferase [Gammaproteobacteria bacterium]